MYDGPYGVILLMYGSQDIRHIGFRRFTVVNGTPGNGASHLKHRIVRHYDCFGYIGCERGSRKSYG